MESTQDRNLRKEIEEKLNDEVLRGALGRFAEAYPTARAKAYENVEDLDSLRESFRQMKINPFPFCLPILPSPYTRYPSTLPRTFSFKLEYQISAVIINIG